MSVLHVALTDIVPNRYRNIKKYQISDDKVAALIQSYHSTGFWDGSIQARPHPTMAGKYEIAFGHHRIEAARLFRGADGGRLTEVGLVVADRSNADMLKMMADENRDEFKHDAIVAVETVGTVIEAFGRGEIDLEKVDSQHGRKDAHDLPGGKSYTLGTVARFLGWVKPSTGQATSACQRAFEAYHEREGADVARQLPADKRSEVAVQSVVTAARVARKEAKKEGRTESEQDRMAHSAATKQAEAVKKDTGFKARQTARRVAFETVHGRPPLPDLPKAVQTLVKQIKAINAETIAIYDRLNEALAFVKDLPSEQAEQVAAALDFAAENMQTRPDAFETMANRWRTKANIKNITPARRTLLLKEVV